MDARWLGSRVFSGLCVSFPLRPWWIGRDVFDGTSSDWPPRVFWAQPSVFAPFPFRVARKTRTCGRCVMASPTPSQAACVEASMKLFNILVMNEIGAEARALFDAYVASDSSRRREGTEGNSDDACLDEWINTQPTCTSLLKSPSCGVRRRGDDAGGDSPTSDGACLL